MIVQPPHMSSAHTHRATRHAHQTKGSTRKPMLHPNPMGPMGLTFYLPSPRLNVEFKVVMLKILGNVDVEMLRLCIVKEMLKC